MWIWWAFLTIDHHKEFKVGYCGWASEILHHQPDGWNPNKIVGYSGMLTTVFNWCRISLAHPPYNMTQKIPTDLSRKKSFHWASNDREVCSRGGWICPGKTQEDRTQKMHSWSPTFTNSKISFSGPVLAWFESVSVANQLWLEDFTVILH